MTRVLAPRYFVASVLLLSLAVGLVAVSAARRTRRELAGQLEERGAALAEVVEVASRSAIRGNALLEELIAQRLLDNARLVDRLLLARPLDAEGLEAIREANGLRRIDFLDPDGRSYAVAPPPPAGPMMGMRQGPERHREMMAFMWGRRWGRAPSGSGAPPPAIRDRRFWEGSVFGVAIGARSFPGIIAVHADAGYVLNFRKEIGVERQVEEISRQAGVQAVALVGPDLTVLAHSDPARAAHRSDDPLLAEALAAGRSLSRVVTGADGQPVLAMVRPFALDGHRIGLLRIDLSTASLERTWRQDLRFALALTFGVLLLGGLGLGAIFYVQARHLREVRALEAEVEQRKRLAALGDLAAAVAHEVRNPLNAVSMGLQRLRDEFPPAQSAAEHARVVELVDGEVRRLNGIVEEFLSLARPLPLTPEAVRPADLVEDVAALVDGEARARGVEVAREAAPDLGPARLDRDHMKQVLLNLARNALEAMPHGGRLAMTATRARDALALTVEDTGEGIPPELLPRIFEPYVTTKTRGMGLGLAIARRIVEAHGGRIEAASRVGHGSRFTVILPLAGAPAGG